MTQPKKKKIRRLFWDIETSPNLCLSWRVGYKVNLDQSNIVKERAVICIAWKWEGEKQTHAMTWDAEQNDRDMLAAFLEVANEADELIAHNGDKFDLPWFRTRLLFHGLRPFPEYKTIDTCSWARRLFLFNSNKLDYIARFLGIGCKISTGYNLWKSIVQHKDSKALVRMVRYNKNDVILLEKVWDRLRVAATHKTHAGVIAGGESWHCPHCASEDVKKAKTRVTASGSLKHQMVCKKCGGFYSINNSAFKRYEDHDKLGNDNHGALPDKAKPRLRRAA